MGKPNGAAAIYALALRKAIDKQGVSFRGLGKLSDPDDPERGRRRVQRHVSGTHMPSRASQRTYGDLLSAPELLPDDDEEDSDAVAALMREVRAARSRANELERIIDRHNARLVRVA